jgi:hypothetical protein
VACEKKKGDLASIKSGLKNRRYSGILLFKLRASFFRRRDGAYGALGSSQKNTHNLSVHQTLRATTYVGSLDGQKNLYWFKQKHISTIFTQLSPSVSATNVAGDSAGLCKKYGCGLKDFLRTTEAAGAKRESILQIGD